MAMNPDEEVTKQFAQTRSRLKARQDVAKQGALEQLKQQESMAGGFGGAQAKMRNKALKDIEAAFAGEEAGLGAAEAESKIALGEAERGRQFAREERLGSEKFAAEQAEKQLSEARRQFDTEFTENQRTNIINTITALKDAGLKSEKDWAKLFDTIQFLDAGDVISGFENVRPRNRIGTSAGQEFVPEGRYTSPLTRPSPV